MAIPKKIHYVWVGNAPIPDKDKAYMETWRSLNPDYEIRRWTEKDIDLEEYPIIAKALHEKRWALAADIIRMYAVYQEGVIYLDTDIKLIKPLDPLLSYSAFACFESRYWFTTAAFGAEAHNPWVGKILKRYRVIDPCKPIVTDTFLKTVHSPSVYAKDFYNIKLDGDTHIYQDGEFITLAPEYFCPKHYLTGELKVTDKTIGIHYYASTWHTWIEKAKNKAALASYEALGAEKYAKLEKAFNERMERKIRRDLP